MNNTDPGVDAYIAKSAAFAQPILTHLRKLVHEAAPNLQETIKWGMPHFQGKGLVCGIAAFTEHCAFGFWNDTQVFDDGKTPAAKEAMGQFGCIRTTCSIGGAREPTEKVSAQCPVSVRGRFPRRTENRASA